MKLWSRLGPTERAKLLTLTGGGRPTTTILRLLTTVAGSAILVTGPDGTPPITPARSGCSCARLPTPSATITDSAGEGRQRPVVRIGYLGENSPRSPGAECGWARPHAKRSVNDRSSSPVSEVSLPQRRDDVQDDDQRIVQIDHRTHLQDGADGRLSPLPEFGYPLGRRVRGPVSANESMAPPPDRVTGDGGARRCHHPFVILHRSNRFTPLDVVEYVQNFVGYPGAQCPGFERKGVSAMNDPLHTVPEADRLEQDLSADPALGAAGPADWEADATWDAPEADRFEQTQPVSSAEDSWRAGGLETEWDVPEADRLEQATTVAFDDEDRDEPAGGGGGVRGGGGIAVTTPAPPDGTGRAAERGGAR